MVYDVAAGVVVADMIQDIGARGRIQGYGCQYATTCIKLSMRVIVRD